MGREALAAESTSVTPLSWTTIWLRALFQPSVSTFQEFVRDPHASVGRAYLWISVSVLAGGLLGTELGALSGTFGTAYQPLVVFLGMPIVAVAALGVFAVGINLTQLAARALGGRGSWRAMAFASASYLAPLLFLLGLVYAVPVVSCTLVLQAAYAFFLGVVTTRAVHDLSWVRAGLTQLAGWLALATLVGCFLVGLLFLAPPGLSVPGK